MNSRITNANLGTVKAELSRMIRVASQREDVRTFALSITPDFDEDQIKAVHQYVQSNIRYQPDPEGSELFIAPHRMIEMIKSGQAYGDCDDIALFCASIYRALGYESRIAVLDTGDAYHAVCEVHSKKLREWLIIDATVKDPLGWVPTGTKRVTEIS